MGNMVQIHDKLTGEYYTVEVDDDGNMNECTKKLLARNDKVREQREAYDQGHDVTQTLYSAVFPAPARLERAAQIRFELCALNQNRPFPFVAFCFTLPPHDNRAT